MSMSFSMKQQGIRRAGGVGRGWTNCQQDCWRKYCIFQK
uniref:Uncharacterized protein n=1 Tax=Podoviridae sp. ctIpM11 TaxID=2825240 RepID=A0A8S5UUC3_9CAUD|nr:MAG TPA: hypothetical protein [Podoviridae sp. ctIpM11]